MSTDPRRGSLPGGFQAIEGTPSPVARTADQTQADEHERLRNEQEDTIAELNAALTESNNELTSLRALVEELRADRPSAQETTPVVNRPTTWKTTVEEVPEDEDSPLAYRRTYASDHGSMAATPTPGNPTGRMRDRGRPDPSRRLGSRQPSLSDLATPAPPRLATAPGRDAAQSRRQSEMPEVAMFSRQAPKDFELNKGRAEYGSPPESNYGDDFTTPAGHNRIKRPYADTGRIMRALDEAIPLGSLASEKARAERKAATEARALKKPDPKPYSGSGDPRQLKIWQMDLSFWFKGSGVSINSAEAVSYIASALEGPAHAWFIDHVSEDVADFWRLVEDEGLTLDVATPSPWPFHDIVASLKDRFIDSDWQIAAAQRFEELAQVKDGHKRLTVEQLADRLIELRAQMVECTETRMKERFFNALEPPLAGDVSREIRVTDPRVDFHMLKEVARECERSRLAVKASFILAKRGQRLNNMAALNASQAASIIAQDEAEKRRNQKKRELAAQGGKDGKALQGVESQPQKGPQGNNAKQNGQTRKPKSNLCFTCGKEGCRSWKHKDNEGSNETKSKECQEVIRQENVSEEPKESPGEPNLKQRAELVLHAFEYMKPVVAPGDSEEVTRSRDSVTTFVQGVGGAQTEKVFENIETLEKVLATCNSFEYDDRPWDETETDWCDPDTMEASGMNTTSQHPPQSKSKDQSFVRGPLKCAHVSLDAVFDTAASHCFMTPDAASAAKVETHVYDEPVQLKLAVSGSRATVNRWAYLEFELNGAHHKWKFDIVALKGKDAIIGMDFLRAKEAVLVCEPPAVFLGGTESIPKKVLAAVDATEADPTSKDSLPEDWPSDEEARAFQEEMFRKYAGAFRSKDEAPELPPMRDVKHTVPLKDPTVRMKPVVYPVPDKYMGQFTEIYKQRVEAGIWVPVSTANASPMMVLGKNDGQGVRIVVNLKERNSNTEKVVSPLPRMDQIINALANKRYRSSFEVAGAFEQCRVAEEDVSKNTISTVLGTVASRVAIQGDLNSPNSCQRMMNEVYAEQIGNSLMVYIDDCFVGSDTWEDHKRDTETFLATSLKRGVKLAKHKWQFLPKEMHALGRRIDFKGISLDPAHIQALTAFPAPRDKKAVERWCGLLAWCEIDLPDVGRMNAPIAALKGKGDFTWSSATAAAFRDIKLLIKEAVLKNQKRVALHQEDLADPNDRPVHVTRRPDHEGPQNPHRGEHLFLATDASAQGYGGGLFVGPNWWKVRPLGFFSRRYVDAQAHYPVHHQEMLAVIEGLKKFRLLVEGQQVTVLTDNAALKAPHMRSDDSNRMKRWLDKLQEFHVDIKYIEGESNGFADALSRVALPTRLARKPESELCSLEGKTDGEDCDERDQTETWQDEDAEPSSPAWEDIHGAEDLSAVTRGGRKPRKAGMKDHETPVATKTSSPKNKPLTKAEMKDLRVRLDRAPESWAKPDNALVALNRQYQDQLLRVIGEAYESDLQLCKARQQTHGHAYELQTGFSEHTFPLPDGGTTTLLYHLHDSHWRLCLPDATHDGRKVREIFLEHVHTLLGHFGLDKMMAYLVKHFWWPSMTKDTKAYCDTCPSCQACKPKTGAPEGLRHALALPPHPWHTVGIDFIGPLPRSKLHESYYDFLLVVVDHFSGETQLIPTSQTVSANELADIWLTSLYPHHGLPRQIVSDRDVRFIGQFWQILHARLGTTLSMSSSYHPQSNGKVERTNRTINSILRQLVNEYQTDWVVQLPFVQFAINSAQSESTGHAPFELTRGYLPASLSSILSPKEAETAVGRADDASRFVARARVN